MWDAELDWAQAGFLGRLQGPLFPVKQPLRQLYSQVKIFMWLFKFKQTSGNVYCKHTHYVLVETLSGFNPLSPVPGVMGSFPFTHLFQEGVVAKDS